MTKNVKKIGILTGGGDCPGLNAVIRAVVKTATDVHGIEVIGFKDGYDGLVNDKFVILRNNMVSGILTLGGTILGTSNIANPYNYARRSVSGVKYEDLSKQAVENYRKNGLEALIAVGGDGTLSIALKLARDGINIVGVPKTIDNDLSGTDRTFGFDSAVATATEAVDKLHSTAQSHHRVMIVEVMGRYAGWIALASGVAGGGDVILIPEMPFDIKKICEKIEARRRAGKRFSIVVAAEGAKPVGGEVTVKRIVADSPDKIRLGGVANKVAEDIEKMTGIETRATILGHVQRGGTPTAYDRILATRYGHTAVSLVLAGKFGHMAALAGDEMTSVEIHKAVDNLKLVRPDSVLIRTAKETGVCFGD